ncbi:hypothetical protein AOLI_G00291160 [Acnodon oligacanthus]
MTVRWRSGGAVWEENDSPKHVKPPVSGAEPAEAREKKKIPNYKRQNKRTCGRRRIRLTAATSVTPSACGWAEAEPDLRLEPERGLFRTCLRFHVRGQRRAESSVKWAFKPMQKLEVQQEPS